MKYKLLFGIVIICMMAVSAAAFNMPHPIYGKISSNGYAVDGLEVQVKNLDTSASAITTTNNQGFYQIDLGNIDDRYNDGDNIKVSIVYCGSLDRCTKTVSVTGGGNQITFDIAKEDIPDNAIIVKVQCWDGSGASTVENCPEKVVCWDKSEVTDETNCPEKDSTGLALSLISGLIGIALVIIGKFKWGKGFVGLANYYKRLGDEAKARGDNAVAEKHYMRAAKMVSTAISRAKDGTYY